MAKVMGMLLGMVGPSYGPRKRKEKDRNFVVIIAYSL